MQITDFFERIIKLPELPSNRPSGENVEGSRQYGSDNIERAALRESETHEQRRRLLAETALRRLEKADDGTLARDGAARGSCFVKTSGSDRSREAPEVDTDCVILDYDDDDGPSERPEDTSGTSGKPATGAQKERVRAEIQPTGASTALTGGGQWQQTIVCPCCSKEWGALEISNADLNDHLDACLMGQAM